MFLLICFEAHKLTMVGQIHDNPELCYEEFKAHDSITSLLESEGFPVTPHAHGIQTSFVAEYGEGGRLVTFCAEYDALEGVGHGCGHNLIATAAVSSFLGVAALLKKTKSPGRVRLLGCPAEEGGGGKIKLIEAGAFTGVDAALMLHPTPPVEGRPSSLAGISYGTCLAAGRFRVRFRGKAAHAGAMPWMGVNALDAATLAYSAVGMLRQQILPTDRVNIVIRDGGSSSNIITDDTTVDVSTRSATTKQMKALSERVRKCFEGAALATGCTCEITTG
jgi:Xaa-Arg dipeptidase